MLQRKTTTDSKDTLAKQAMTIGAFVAVFWIVEILDQAAFGGSLDQEGIRPRSAEGLLGILFAPFLHGNFDHLIANTLPFIFLGWLVRLRGQGPFLAATVVIGFVAGLGVWLIGASDSVHIGASSLVFGYFGFIVAAGIFERSLLAILLAVGVAVVYGGIIYGVLPSQRGISWEGHLFGFIGGVGGARMIAVRKKAPAAATPVARLRG